MGSPKEVLRRLHDAGNWFLIPRDLFFAMSHVDAIVLSHLCNVGGMKEAEQELKDEKWFRCSSLSIRKRLNISTAQQTDIMQRLESAGLITRRMMGSPGKRHIRINYDQVEAAMEAGFGNQQLAFNTRTRSASVK